MKLIFRMSSVFGLAILAVFTYSCNQTQTARKPEKVRLAKIVVDSAQLESYKSFLQEEIEQSIQKEPGVLSLYAVFEKEKPTHFTILEIYADQAAYAAHLKTPHFIKYKEGTKNMVKELELVEVDPLIPTLKIK